MRLHNFTWPLLLTLFAAAAISCASDDTSSDSGVSEAFFDEDYGKPLLGEAPAPGKDDSLSGRLGLPVSVDTGDTAVWSVRNKWADTDTAEARKAGIAWSADSGLSWDEKYAAWIESMEKIDGHNTYYQTFELTTPWDKKVPAPSLECAEVSIFLRVTFASWYGLPFYLEAVDGKGVRVYFGHFGAVTVNGRYNNTPRYRDLYKDYSRMTAADIARDGWPSDAKLRERKIGGTSPDFQPFLGEDLHAGAYFDEIYLNKRVGYFMTLVLSYFGSINLADSNNTFNLVPSATRPGDTLLERWQRRGIGHTLVVKHVVQLPNGGLEAELVSGSMPRRQPKWEDPAGSKRTFTDETTGGEGSGYDGDEYAKLGGGIKRWRTPAAINGRWSNIVPAADKSVWIPNYEYATIAARPGQFEELLGELTPELMRDSVINQIEDARLHLQQYPASCSARTRREQGFTELYALNSEHFGLSAAATDAQYRRLEDYVFAELVYEQSKTCCWNSTTAAMHEIVMDYNAKIVLDETTGTCNPPVVFMSRDGGDYAIFRQHAADLGREAEWVAWSEDEPCGQRAVDADTEAAHAWVPYCDVASQLGTTTAGCTDAFDGNDAQASAATITAGNHSALQVCEGSEDWYRVDLTAAQTLTASVTFVHATGDLDLEVYSAEGNVLGNSTTSDDRENVEISLGFDGPVFVRVFGYQGAANAYAMVIAVN